MKAQEQLKAFGAMLNLIADKAKTTAMAIETQHSKLPTLLEQLRGSLDVMDTASKNIRETLTSIDGKQ